MSGSRRSVACAAAQRRDAAGGAAGLEHHQQPGDTGDQQQRDQQQRPAGTARAGQPAQPGPPALRPALPVQRPDFRVQLAEVVRNDDPVDPGGPAGPAGAVVLVVTAHCSTLRSRRDGRNVPARPVVGEDRIRRYAVRGPPARGSLLVKPPPAPVCGPDLRKRPAQRVSSASGRVILEGAKGVTHTWFSRSARPSSTRTTGPLSSRRSRPAPSRARRRSTWSSRSPRAISPCGFPPTNAEIVGVRDVVGQEGLDRVFEVLRAPHTEEPTNWSRRYKANLEKLASGDVNKVAEVVRDLWRRDKDRGLSAGEKRMLAKARQILVSELALAEGTNEDKAEVLLDEVLAS